MFRKIKESINFLERFLSYQRYFLIFIIVSFISFVVFYKLTLVNIANQSLKIFVMMSGFQYTVVQLFILGIISLLFGIFVSLLVYKIRLTQKIKKSSSMWGSFGLIFGLFSAGCPTCGALLFSLIGMPLALMYLPFKGLELKILSIILMSISIYFLSRSLIECKIKK